MFHQTLQRIGSLLAAGFALTLLANIQQCLGTKSAYLLNALQSPVIFRGDATTAYRDPAAIYSNGWFYLYFTLTRIEGPGQVFQYTAWSKSSDLTHWTEPKVFTPRDNRLNYGSPGDVIRFAGEWFMPANISSPSWRAIRQRRRTHLDHAQPGS